MGSDYYKHLADPMKMSSTGAAQAEYNKAKEVEIGRLNLFLNSPAFKEMQIQTAQINEILKKQDRQITELKKQNEKLSDQLDQLKKSEDDTKKKARRALIGFWITTAVAVATLVVAILAWVLPR